MDHNIKAFEQWANDEGYDVANTYDTERSKWIWLNPMTADLWRAYEAALSQSTQSVSEPVAQQEPVSPAQALTDSEVAKILKEQIRGLDRAGFELTARLVAIGVVAEKDGYELIRRDSAMEFVTTWRRMRDAAMQGDAK